jgi:hypothetical protein
MKNLKQDIMGLYQEYLNKYGNKPVARKYDDMEYSDRVRRVYRSLNYFIDKEIQFLEGCIAEKRGDNGDRKCWEADIKTLNDLKEEIVTLHYIYINYDPLVKGRSLKNGVWEMMRQKLYTLVNTPVEEILHKYTLPTNDLIYHINNILHSAKSFYMINGIR